MHDTQRMRAQIQAEEGVSPPAWSQNARLGRFTNFVNLLDMCGVAVPSGVLRYDHADAVARGLPWARLRHAHAHTGAQAPMPRPTNSSCFTSVHLTSSKESQVATSGGCLSPLDRLPPSAHVPGRLLF
jgi:hypothetical protein